MRYRGLLLQAVLVLSAVGALGAASYAFPPQDRSAQELPQGEEALLRYAQERMNRNAWQEADRAFKAFLERHPDVPAAEGVHTQLGQLHLWHSRRPAEAREWYEKACARWPKSSNYWGWRFQIAQTYAQQNLRDKAVAAYRAIGKEAADAGQRAQAIQQAWNLEGKYFYMSVHQTFTAGQSPAVNVQLRGIEKIDFRAVHIPYDALVPHLQGADGADLHAAIGKVPKEGRRELKSWTQTYVYDRNNDWKNESVKVPSTEPGVYLVEGDYDGVTMSVTLFVSRNGLTAKAAAGKLLCFVQDRATSKPVADVAIRVLHGEAKIEGRTDAQGIFAADGFKGGVVIALKDGDLATTQSYYSAANGERPLIHITTDRPIYRPNQKVFFRIVHRTETGESLEVEPGRRMVVEIRDAKGNKVYEKPHTLDAFGATEGEIVLGDEPPLGEYVIVTRTEKDSPDLHQHDWRWMGRWGHGPHNVVRFRVDEYRKPEYKVDVTYAKPRVLQGEAVEATIDARYYFGSPVTEAEATWQVFRRPSYYVWRCWPYYYDWYADDEEMHGRKGYWGAGEMVLQGSGKTDREGKVKVVFTPEKQDHDAIYTVVAKVTDVSRRAVDGSSSCKAARAEFGLAMTLDRHVYKPGDRVNAKVRAATPDDRPVAGTRVTLKAYDRRWQRDRYDDALLFEGAAVSDAQGVAEFNLHPEREGGYLWMVAEAQDARGNAVKAEQYAWLCGDRWGGSTVNLNGVDLVLDKKTYDLGDTAQLLVTSQFRDVTLLLTVEGKEIHHHEVVRVNGHMKVVDLKIDRQAWAPNVYVSLSGLKENAVVQKRRMLIVNPGAKFLSVEITPDKAQYKPREKAVYEVKTLGADGRPAAAQVSLGVIDDSLYALQDDYAEDIRKHFIHRRGTEVVTNTSLQYHGWGRAERKLARAGGAAAPAAPAAEAAASKDEFGELRAQNGQKADKAKQARENAPTEIRSNFADTMLWKTVTTGPDGRARIDVDVPDNLTTWTATARAVTADGRFGQSGNQVIVRKDMIVRLQTPRFFTQNDATVFSAVAHNYLKAEKEVTVEMAVEGLDVDGPRSQVVRIAPEGHARIDWTARVRTAGTAKVTVKALSDEASDAMQLVVPVLPHGTLKYDSRAGLVEGRVVEKVLIPGGATKEGADLTVVVSPTHAAMVLDALDYLAGYPYGCVEQTMSRFLPTVVVSQALQKLGIEKKDLQAELPAMVSAGLQRLYNFQQQDGGWGWWQNDASNPWTTAYVVTGLAMARNADHPVEAHVFTRGLQALQRHLSASTEPNEQAYLLHALSTAGLRSDEVRSRLTDRLSDLGPYGKALLALVLAKDGRPAKDVLAALERDAKAVGGSVHFEGAKGRGGWMDHDMEVSAAALRAFLAVEPRHPLVGRLVHWLSTVRQGNYWGSTKQTAMVVFSLMEYLALSGDMNPDMTLTLSLNGERVFSERVTKENWHAFRGTRTFKGAQLRDGENEIVIERTGNGTPLYSVYARTYAEGEDIEASKGGIQLERTYGKVVWDGKQRRVLPLASGATVSSGDEVEVTVVVRADRDHEWLMLDIPMPSGFEAIREHWGTPGWGRWSYWYSQKEFRDEKVSVAMTSLRRGVQHVSYVMRAEAPGDVHILPAVVFNMYHPEIGGNSDEFRLKVLSN